MNDFLNSSVSHLYLFFNSLLNKYTNAIFIYKCNFHKKDRNNGSSTDRTLCRMDFECYVFVTSKTSKSPEQAHILVCVCAKKRKARISKTLESRAFSLVLMVGRHGVEPWTYWLRVNRYARKTIIKSTIYKKRSVFVPFFG